MSHQAQPRTHPYQYHQARHARHQPQPRGHYSTSQARPHYNPRQVHPEEVQASQEENVYGDRLCKLCSDTDHSVYHHHMSSQAIRDFARKHQRGYLFGCLMCKQSESTVRPSTRKIILTSSTLYNVWNSDELQLPIHVEMEAIVGGRVRDMTRALIKLYFRYKERLEIILIAGLNNIGESQTAEEIIEELIELKDAVKAHSTVHGHVQPSVVSISTLMYAPKFCALDVPDSIADWKPPPNFNNKRQVVEATNAAIAAMNKADNVNYLNLHFEGIRKDRKTGKTMHRHHTSTPIWRETEVRKKLHLTTKFKVKIVQRAAKIFMAGLQNVGSWVPTAE